jgi:hypothetical protein
MEAGTDLRTIQLLMGHAHLEHTTLYLHLSHRHLHAAANPVDRSPFVATARRASGRRTISREAAALGGGRRHSQGRKQIHRRLSQLVDLGTAQGAPGDRALPRVRCGYQAISYNSCRNLFEASSATLLEIAADPKHLVGLAVIAATL